MYWMLTLVMMSLPALACAQEAPALKTEKEKLSYSMGMDLGNQLKEKSVEIDPAVFGRGLSDALSGGKTLLTEEEAQDGHLQSATGDDRQTGRGDEGCRREEQDGRRRVPRRQQGEGRGRHASERPPVQGSDHRRRQEADP